MLPTLFKNPPQLNSDLAQRHDNAARMMRSPARANGIPK